MSDQPVFNVPFTQTKDFFVGIDSDGCVFDTMEIKHKECFCPAFINHMELQSVSKYARQVWEFVNLYSKTRGVNRFKVLIEAMDLLKERKEVKAKNLKLYELSGVREWIEKVPSPGMKALEKELKQNPHRDLQLAWRWSREVDENIRRIVRGVTPFTHVQKTLSLIQKKADTMVISSAPVKNITGEWNEHNIIDLTDSICGQEMGNKTNLLKMATVNHYDSDKVLMLGDAPGDYRAAKSNNALFFPIIPGLEEESWEELYTTGLNRFFEGNFKGSYEEKKYDQFMAALPETPNWKG